MHPRETDLLGKAGVVINALGLPLIMEIALKRLKGDGKQETNQHGAWGRGEKRTGSKMPTSMELGGGANIGAYGISKR